MLAGQQKAMAEVNARLATARLDLKRALDEARRTERELNEARRANAAAAAAHGLCPGDECPVCHGDLPEGWTPPHDTGLEAADKAHGKARSQAEEANKAVVDLKAQRTSAEQGITRITRDLGRPPIRLRQRAGPPSRRGRAGRRPAACSDAPLPDRERVLAPAKQRLREAEEKLSRHRAEAEGLRETQTSAQMAEQSARQTLIHARNDHERTRKTAGQGLDALNRNIQSIPQPSRPRLVLPLDPVELEAVDTTPVDRASYTAREREEILQQRDRKRTRLRTEIEETRTAVKRLGETRKAQVEAPLQALVRALATHRTALGDAVRDLAADIAIPAIVHYPVDAETLREGFGRLRDAMAEALARAADLRRRALAAAEEARGEARKVAEQLDPPVDPSDLEALIHATGKAADDARYAARDAVRDHDAFAAILDDLLLLRQTADEVAALELALGDLDAALKPGAFLKWLTLRRSRDLLVHASRMLKEMTGSRYSFADPGDLEDQQWLVVDNDSGQARSPASLSGGEQFIGSLALALGMVEMMARSGGRLESLFLDEGFGSLDRNNLDAAIEALSMVAGTGRMVA